MIELCLSPLFLAGFVMKAVQISRFGDPEVLRLVDLPTPRPGPGQVLVRVHAAGINFAETLMRENRYAVTPALPSILGTEAVGEVCDPGTCAGWFIGQRVAAPLFAVGNFFGGYASHVLIDASVLVALPDRLAYDQAAALMVQGLSALALTRHAELRDKVVLVNAAAGGVGTLLLQLARRAGARKVIAAASTGAKRALALSLGADVALDYTASDWVEAVRDASDGVGPDVIYESAGGAITTSSLAALAPRGVLVIFGALNIQSFSLGVPELLQLIFKNQSIRGFALAPLLTPQVLKDDLSALFDLAVQGRLEVHIGGRYPLAAAAQAHHALASRQSVGKLVLLPDADS